MANRPSRIEITVQRASADHRYYGRYPKGDAPASTIALLGSAHSTSSASGTLIQAATPANGGVQVGSGAHIFDLKTGNPIQFFGVNISGLEGSASGAPCWDAFANTTVQEWQQILAPNVVNPRGVNVVRLPLSSAYWMNVTGIDPGAGNDAKGVPYMSHIYHNNGNGTWTADPSNSYRAKVIQAATRITQAGAKVILDLHWGVVRSTSGQNILPAGQGSYMGMEVDVLQFWASVAATFKGNLNVMLEIHNEPFGTDNFNQWDNPFPNAGADCFTMLNGGLWHGANGGGVGFQMQNNLNGSNHLFVLNGGADVNVGGKQAALNVIRNAGFQGVILDSPIGYAGQIETWMQTKPADPLHNLACAWHIYSWPGGNTNNATQWPLAVRAAGYPIIVTETYHFNHNEFGGYAFCQANNIGALWWSWNNWAAQPDLTAWIKRAPWDPYGTAPNA